ncbi:MAG: 4Fe-4S dicluster domain-containing protein [Pirellulales bacterium]|nr:4Fe-4S dicluster domain-containing protein [Pirellulales bacterium]
MNREMLTRDIYGNIDSVSKVIFYILSAAALACCAAGIWHHVRRWRREGRPFGSPSSPAFDWKGIFSRFWTRVLSQTALRRGRVGAGWMHSLLFWGFAVLFLGTVLVSTEYYAATLLGRTAGDPLFHKGLYFAIFECVLDLAGLALIAGIVWFAIRRARGTSSMAHQGSDWLVIGLLISLGITGYCLEGGRIVLEQTPAPALSPVGYVCSLPIAAADPGPAVVGRMHRTFWWIHALLALGLVAIFPYSRLLHALAGTVRLMATPRALGSMEPISIEQVELAGFIGVDRLEHLTCLQRIELHACVACGRCQDVCPAHIAKKPLSPRDVVQDLRFQLDQWTRSADTNTDPGAVSQQSLCGAVIADETLWACTTCGACEDICPLDVGPLTFITDMRRFFVGDGRFRGAPAAALARMQRSGNPWGLPAEDRLNWAQDLDIRTAADGGDSDLLYWVGCAAAYDPNCQRIARSMVRLLQRANVPFTVLGNEERCTGDSARRMGDEFVFQELATRNIETLHRYGIKKIVTHCPHCLNSLRNDYPQFGGLFDVVHHSELLLDLIETGRLPIDGSDLFNHSAAIRATYHDPCYLARIQRISQPPRQVLDHLLTHGHLSERIEMARHGRETACCGGGGGRMWFDDTPSDRIGIDRFDEVVATGADTVAVGCPFCKIMFHDAASDRGSSIQVRDIAELLAEKILQ